MTRRIAVGLLVIALAQFLVPLLPVLGLGESIGSRATSGGRPPELPPGAFFSIWSVIFLAYFIFALLAVLKPSYLERRLGGPLLLAGVGNIAWMLSAQLVGNQRLDFLLLWPILAFAWTGARRLHRMGGFDGTWRRANACVLTGLWSGWIAVAVSISVPATWRVLSGLGPSDDVWISLWMALVSAGLLAWLFASRVSASVLFFAALAWGLAGVALNNWYLTGMHWLSGASLLAGGYILWRRARHGARAAFE